MTVEDFKKLNAERARAGKEQFANPRNAKPFDLYRDSGIRRRGERDNRADRASVTRNDGAHGAANEDSDAAGFDTAGCSGPAGDAADVPHGENAANVYAARDDHRDGALAHAGRVRRRLQRNHKGTGDADDHGHFRHADAKNRSGANIS